MKRAFRLNGIYRNVVCSVASPFTAVPRDLSLGETKIKSQEALATGYERQCARECHVIKQNKKQNGLNMQIAIIKISKRNF